MIEENLLDYIKSITEQTDLQIKSKMIIKGCVHFFSFQRASLFSYSKMSGIGEGLFACTKDVCYPMHFMKEDIRAIPPIHQAITHTEPLFLTLRHTKSSIPEKYIKQFSLSSLAVVPISINEIVIGFVIADWNKHERPVTHKDLLKLSYFLQLAVNERQKSILHCPISKRESEALQHLANGLSMKQIAPLMGVSEFTVRDYISSTIRKLGVNHRTEAVAMALRSGIIL